MTNIAKISIWTGDDLDMLLDLNTKPAAVFRVAARLRGSRTTATETRRV